MNLKTFFPNVKILANVMPWLGEPNHVHRCTAYTSNNLYTIQSQLDVMMSSGIDGVILTWRGTTVNNGWDQDVADKIAFQCSDRKLLFAYMLDPGILKYRQNQSISNEQELINQLSAANVQQVINNGAYLPEGYIFDFLTGYTVNWAQVFSAMPAGSLKLQALKRNVDYSWPCLQPIATVQQWHQSQTMQVPGLSLGFNDAGCPLPYGVKQQSQLTGRDYTQSVWSTAANSQPCRVNDPQAGAYFYQTIDSIKNGSPSCQNAKYIGLVTWNDYDEQTAIEQWCSASSGIRIR